MPYAAPTVCPRCKRTDCQGHYDRKKTAERGYGARHRKWRMAVLSRDIFCVFCLEQGRMEDATVADHIRPINPDGTGDWSLENGRGLCRECHEKRHGRLR